MTRSKVFKNRERKARDDIYKRFSRQLDKFSPGMLVNRGSSQTMDDILGHAVDLHKAIRCSREDYVMRRPTFEPLWIEGDLKEWKLRLLDTWRDVGPDETLTPCIGLIPGLYKERYSDGNNSPFELVKPVVIVCLTALKEDSSSAFTPVEDRDRAARGSDRRARSTHSSKSWSLFPMRRTPSSTIQSGLIHQARTQ